MARAAPIETPQSHIFVSYAHDDQERILPELDWLKSQGYSIWYDIEIRPGTTWADELAAAIDSSRFVLYFVSERSITSLHCLNEIAYALEAGKPVLAVYLEPVELTGGLRLSMSRTQALLHWQLKQAEFRAQIREAVENLFSNTGHAAALRQTPGHGPAQPVRKIWQVPLSRNLHFMGRDQQIDEIADAFAQSPRPLVLALTGLGGVGKSQLALEYLYRHRRDVPVVAWIRAENAATMETDFVAFAKAIGLVEADDADIRLVIAAVHEWLENHDQWFLVLDNVTNPKALRQCLPRVLSANVLLTTRHQGWGNHARAKAVAPFRDDEARAFVMDRTGDSDTESAASLVAMLGGLPLALEEAVAYMEATGRSIASYLGLFKSFRDHLLSRSRPTADYPATLRTTWEMSFRQLEESEPGAAALLNVLAFLGPEDIPKSLLLAYETAEQPDLPPELLVDEYLAALLRYSLVKLDNDAVSIHRLVQMVTRDRLGLEQRQQNAVTALEVIEQSFPASGAVGDMLPDCGRLLPHALASLEHCRQLDEARLCAARLLARTGTYLCARGSTARGIEQLEQTVETLRQLDDRSAEYAHACELLGRACYQCGKLPQARSLLDNAIEIFERIGDPGGTNFALCLTELAWICWTDGDGPAARAAAERCLSLVGGPGGRPDPRLLGGQAILSRVLLDEGRMAEALATTESCVALIGALRGARHPLMCGPFIHLAQVLLDAGMPLRARSWAQEALSLVGPAYGEQHPFVSASRCIMGQILTQLGEDEAALHEYQAAMDSVRRSDSPVPQVSVISGALQIRLLADLGREAEAAAMLDEMIHLSGSKVCGDTVLAKAHALLAEAVVAHLGGDAERARVASNEADRLICSRYGEQHPYRVPALIGLGRMLSATGAPAEAAPPIDQAMQVLQQNELHLHPQAAEAFLVLASIADSTGNGDEALQHRDEALRILKRATGPSSHATIALESQLAGSQ